MTRGDIGYLLVFLGVLALTGVFISSGSWLAALVPGVLALLLAGHMALNLFLSPFDSNEVMSWLRALGDPTGTRDMLHDYDGGDYSSFEAFCDTPIITNRQLSAIRVSCCRLLHDARFFRRDPATNELTITKEGSAAVRALLATMGASSGGGGTPDEG